MKSFTASTWCIIAFLFFNVSRSAADSEIVGPLGHMLAESTWVMDVKVVSITELGVTKRGDPETPVISRDYVARLEVEALLKGEPPTGEKLQTVLLPVQSTSDERLRGGRYLELMAGDKFRLFAHRLRANKEGMLEASARLGGIRPEAYQRPLGTPTSGPVTIEELAPVYAEFAYDARTGRLTGPNAAPSSAPAAIPAAESPESGPVNDSAPPPPEPSPTPPVPDAPDAAPVITPTKPPPAESSSPRWWIVAALATLAAGLLLARRKKS